MRGTEGDGDCPRDVGVDGEDVGEQLEAVEDGCEGLGRGLGRRGTGGGGEVSGLARGMVWRR